MIKTATADVAVTPVDGYGRAVGSSVQTVQHMVYHVDQSPGVSTKTVAMVDSGLRFKIHPDSTVAALHVLSIETELDLYYPVRNLPHFDSGGGYYTTETPLVLVPEDSEDEQREGPTEEDDLDELRLDDQLNAMDAAGLDDEGR